MSGVWPSRMVRSPSELRSTRPLAGTSRSCCSGVTTRTSKTPSAMSALALQLPGLLQHRLGAADVQEGLLGGVVEVAVDQGLEGLDGLGDGDGDALQAGEDLADVERLGQETLDLPGPGHGDPVLLGELVETEDGDDVLELLVPLEDPLDLAGEDVGGGGQRVDGRVDAEGGDLPGQLGGGVEVGEGGERGRVGVVVGGDVDGLHRGDGPATGGGDPLLE